MEFHDKICNLVETDDVLKSWIRRAYEERYVSGYQALAVIYYFIYDPENTEQNKEKVIDHWKTILSGAIDDRRLRVMDKDSFAWLNRDQAKNANGDALIYVSDIDDFLESYEYNRFCSETIENLFGEIYPDEVKTSTNKKESTRLTENLYRAIACLAIDGYGYNLEDNKSTVPGELSKMMRERFDFDITDKTIRGWIKKGTENITIKPHKP